MAGAPGGVSPTSSIAQPGQVLSGQNLIDAAKALANAQTQGPMTELARQIALNNSQSQNAQQQTAGYFGQLGQYGQQALTADRGIQSGLNSQLGTIAGDENARLAQIQTDQTANLNKYTPGDPTLRAPAMQGLTTELARQQGLAAQNEGAFRSLGATEGANNSSLQAQLQGAGMMRGQEMIGQIGRASALANEPLNSKIAALQAQKGALFSTDLGKLRQQEISNQVTEQATGAKVASANASLANAQTNQGKLQVAQWEANPNNVGSQAWTRVQGNTLNGIKAANQNQNYVWQHNDRVAKLLQSNAATGSSKPLSTLDNNRALKALSQIMNTIPYLQRQGVPQKVWNQSQGKMVTQVVKGSAAIQSALSGVDPTGGALIQAAYELLGYGSIDQKTAARLQGVGINISPFTFRGGPVKVTQNYQATPPGLGNGGPGGTMPQNP